MGAKPDEINRKLIEFVEQYPELYNKSNSNYKNAQHKENVWNEISAKIEATLNNVKCSPVICLERWSALKNRYHKEVGKLRKGPRPGSRTETGVSTWSLFSELEFLNEFTAPRRRGDITNASITDENTAENSMVVELDPEDGELYDADEMEFAFVNSNRKKKSKLNDRNALSSIFDADDLSTKKQKLNEEIDIAVKSFTDSLYHEMVKVPSKNQTNCKIEILQAISKRENLDEKMDVAVKSFIDSLCYEMAKVPSKNLTACKIALFQTISQYQE